MGFNFLPLAGDLVKSIFGNKKDKVNLEHSRDEMVYKIAKALEDNQQSLKETGMDLIKSEIESEDPYVRRARPTLFWMMYAIFGFNYICIPLVKSIIAIIVAFQVGNVSVMSGIELTPLTIDPNLMDMFMWAFLGYGTLRTVEKTTGDNANIPERITSIKEKWSKLRETLNRK